MAANEPVTFELFGLEWQRKPFVSYREWAEWYDDDRSIEGLSQFFINPPLEELKAESDVSEMSERILELWLAVRTPPDRGNG